MMSLWLLRAATAAASLLQAPHQGAQNHRSTSFPAKDEGSNTSPEMVERSRTVSAGGTSDPAVLSRAEVSKFRSGACVMGLSLESDATSCRLPVEQAVARARPSIRTTLKNWRRTWQRLCVRSRRTARFVISEHKSLNNHSLSDRIGDPCSFCRPGVNCGLEVTKLKFGHLAKAPLVAGYDWQQNDF